MTNIERQEGFSPAPARTPEIEAKRWYSQGAQFKTILGKDETDISS
jgi:hypothetical protein